MKRSGIVGALLAALLIVGSLGLAVAQDADVTARIVLDGDAIIVDGDGAEVAGTVVTITQAGTYSISGALDDGQIRVNSDDAGAVILVLNGVEITNMTSAPVYVVNAESVTITLADGTQNTLTDGATYVYASADEDEPNAALFSNDDLTIDGTGSLTVTGNYNDAIHSDDGLTISGAPTITATAVDDTIQVSTTFTMLDGSLHLVAGGGSGVTLSEDLSGKGIKADEMIDIEGGTLIIDAADDAIRSETDLVLNDGTIVISAIGKAIHASYNLEVNGGSVEILTADEGLEGGFITINGGYLDITTTDDGINVSEPDDIPNTSLYYLHINDGFIIVNAEGDGIDSNGSITMNGGTVLVNGPTAMDNSALDYDGTFDINGGLLVAVGSAGMAQAPGESSTQSVVLANLDTAQSAGTLVHIAGADGETLLTYAPSKDYQSIVFSSPELTSGATYTVYTGGSVSGTEDGGLYTDATYTAGDEQTSFTVSSVVTTVGNVRGFGGGMRGAPPQGMGQPPEGMGQPPEGMPEPPEGFTPGQPPEGTPETAG
jgi:hypothetical protein